MADENEVKALADRLYDAAVSNAGSPSISVWETAQHAAREALRWRDETRPQQPAAAVPAEDAETLDFARNAARLLHGFMLDTNVIGPKEAGVNLARSIKDMLAAQGVGNEQ